MLTLTNKQGIIIKSGRPFKRNKSPPKKRRYRDYSEDRDSNSQWPNWPIDNSPKAKTPPERFKKDASVDGTVALLDSPGPSTALGRISVDRLQHEKGHFLNGAPPRQYIDAEDAYKIAAQIDFPNTNFRKFINFEFFQAKL